jgi:hypothetical protein
MATWPNEGRQNKVRRRRKGKKIHWKLKVDRILTGEEKGYLVFTIFIFAMLSKRKLYF